MTDTVTYLYENLRNYYNSNSVNLNFSVNSTTCGATLGKDNKYYYDGEAKTEVDDLVFLEKIGEVKININTDRNGGSIQLLTYNANKDVIHLQSNISSDGLSKDNDSEYRDNILINLNAPPDIIENLGRAFRHLAFLCGSRPPPKDPFAN